MPQQYKVLREACEDWSRKYREPVKSVVPTKLELENQQLREKCMLWDVREEVARHQEKMALIQRIIRELEPGVINGSSKDTGRAIIDNLRHAADVASESIRRTWIGFWD